MAFGTAARQSLALLIFNATTWTGVAVNDTGTPITSVFAALHTADPTSGNQTTSESAYTSYTREGVVRTGSGWSSTAGVVTNVAAITFPTCTGSTSTITNVSLGTLTSGTGQVIVAGAVTSSLAVSTGVQPVFAISGLSVTIA